MDRKFEAVKSIEIIKEDTDCLDIETSGTHNFFADGVLVHNCKVCGLVTNEGCKHPDIVAPSPEAIGIDLYSMLPMEVPPIDTYYSVSMVYGNLDHDFTSLNLPKRNENTDHVLNLDNVVKVYDVKDSWQPEASKARCSKCKLFTPFLCNRDRYRDDDLYQTIKDWKLYVIRLKNSIKTVKGIKELHNYQLQAHRQGYWQSFQLLPFRCPIHKDCSLKRHMEGGYLEVQNRAIPMCLSYFNLKVGEKGVNLGYLLV